MLEQVAAGSQSKIATASKEITLDEVKRLTQKKNRLRPSARQALTSFYALAAEHREFAKFFIVQAASGRACVLRE